MDSAIQVTNAETVGFSTNIKMFIKIIFLIKNYKVLVNHSLNNMTYYMFI